MSTLDAFLLARLNEDGARAFKAMEEKWRPGNSVFVEDGKLAADPDVAPDGVWLFMRAWGPQRVIDEVAAKARLLEAHAAHPERANFCRACGLTVGPCETKRLMALPYAVHPEFLHEWVVD